jgi:glucan biosynthesis protein C
MSLIGLPIFLTLHGQRGRRVTAALARFFSLPGAIFLLAIPLTLCETLPTLGGMKFFFDFMLVLLGFVLMSDPAYEQTIDRHRLAGLLAGTVASIGILFISLLSAHWADYSAPSIAYAFLRDFNVWFWMIALLGYGRRLLNVGGAALKYLTEAAYPFYILHQTVIIVVGYFVLRWDVPLAVQFVAIMALATGASFAIYDVLVRRTNVMRFLFGMKPLPPKVPAPEPVRQAA